MLLGFVLLVLSSTAIAISTVVLGSADTADARLGSVFGAGMVFLAVALKVFCGGAGARVALRTLWKCRKYIALLSLGLVGFLLTLPEATNAGAGVIALASATTAVLAFASAGITRTKMMLKIVTGLIALALAFLVGPVEGVLWALLANGMYQVALLLTLRVFETEGADQFMGLGLVFVLGGLVAAAVDWESGGSLPKALALGATMLTLPLLLSAWAARILTTAQMAIGLGLNLAVQTLFQAIIAVFGLGLDTSLSVRTVVAVISITALLVYTAIRDRPRSRT